MLKRYIIWHDAHRNSMQVIYITVDTTTNDLLLTSYVYASGAKSHESVLVKLFWNGVLYNKQFIWYLLEIQSRGFWSKSLCWCISDFWVLHCCNVINSFVQIVVLVSLVEQSASKSRKILPIMLPIIAYVFISTSR